MVLMEIIGWVWQSSLYCYDHDPNTYDDGADRPWCMGEDSEPCDDSSCCPQPVWLDDISPDQLTYEGEILHCETCIALARELHHSTLLAKRFRSLPNSPLIRVLFGVSADRIRRAHCHLNSYKRGHR